MYAGRGRNAKISPGANRQGIRGARFLVRTDAGSAVTEGVSALRGARFAPDATPLQAALQATASPWAAQALTIGRPASRWSLNHVDYEFFPLNLVPLFWPRVALTLAIACARSTDAGTELLIYAHPSMLRAGTRTNDSAPLMSKAAETLQRRFTATGVLLQHEPIAQIVDDDCPASSTFVRSRLGWS